MHVECTSDQSAILVLAVGQAASPMLGVDGWLVLFHYIICHAVWVVASA